MRTTVIIAIILFILPFSKRPIALAEAPLPIKPLAVHAHRYQDFQRRIVVCEVFGEIKNIGNRPVKSFTLHLEMLDRKGKVVAGEDLTLPVRVIVPGNAKGELRPLKPQEIGNFIQGTQNCPEQWLDGRIRYFVKAVQTE